MANAKETKPVVDETPEVAEEPTKDEAKEETPAPAKEDKKEPAKKSKKEDDSELSDEDSAAISKLMEHAYGKPIESIEKVDGGFDVNFADGTGNSAHYPIDDIDEYVKSIPDVYKS